MAIIKLRSLGGNQRADADNNVGMANPYKCQIKFSHKVLKLNNLSKAHEKACHKEHIVVQRNKQWTQQGNQ
jgi:hypothetical protein